MKTDNQGSEVGAIIFAILVVFVGLFMYDRFRDKSLRLEGDVIFLEQNQDGEIVSESNASGTVIYGDADEIKSIFKDESRSVSTASFKESSLTYADTQLGVVKHNIVIDQVACITQSGAAPFADAKDDHNIIIGNCIQATAQQNAIDVKISYFADNPSKIACLDDGCADFSL